MRARSGCAIFITLLLGIAAASSARASNPRELEKLFSKGYYDEVIQRSTEDMQNSPLRDPGTLYLRGRSYFYIDWFAAAEADLTPLKSYAPYLKWPRASDVVAKIATLRRLTPPHTQEVTSGGRALFRVYYDEDEARTRAFIAALPEARRDTCDFYGVELADIAVFIFKDVTRYDAFRETLQSDISEWGWLPAMGFRGCLLFCLQNPSGKGMFNRTEDIPSIVRHECSHALHRRAVGGPRSPLGSRRGWPSTAARWALPRRPLRTSSKRHASRRRGAGFLWRPSPTIKGFMFRRPLRSRTRKASLWSDT